MVRKVRHPPWWLLQFNLPPPKTQGGSGTNLKPVIDRLDHLIRTGDNTNYVANRIHNEKLSVTTSALKYDLFGLECAMKDLAMRLEILIKKKRHNSDGHPEFDLSEFQLQVCFFFFSLPSSIPDHPPLPS